MAELKTKRNDANVKEYLNSVEGDQKRADSLVLLDLFEKITGEKASMWGDSIVGFGSYHYKSDRSTQEGDWPLTGFAPRKQNLTIYIMNGPSEYKEKLEKLGKFKASKGSCLYIKRLSDVDTSVLEEIVKDSYSAMKRKYSN